jgi:hypothetical protein
MSCPAQQPAVVVGFKGLDTESLKELCRTDAVSLSVQDVDPAHRSDAHAETELALAPELSTMATPSGFILRGAGSASCSAPPRPQGREATGTPSPKSRSVRDPAQGREATETPQPTNNSP